MSHFRQGGVGTILTAGRGTATYLFRRKVMRGEHFLLLAEREQLLPPAVLTQLRQILRAQKRPARGEAVARLLVDRGFITVETARRLVQQGSGPGSPLVPSSDPSSSVPGSMIKAPSPLAPRRPAQAPISSTAELILEPGSHPLVPPPVRGDAAVPGERPAGSQTSSGKVTPPPVASHSDYLLAEGDFPSGTRSGNRNFGQADQGETSGGVTPPPVVLQPADEVALSELSDSFSQWMDLPEGPSEEQAASPLFTPQRIKIPMAVIYLGLATVGVLVVLLGLMILTKLRAG